MLSGKTVLLGITSSISAYKACEIVSSLKKMGADVFCCMSENATKLVAPLTFETLSGNKVILNTFDTEREFEIQHIALQKRADIFVIAPATANIIGKIASGVADDFVSTTALAFSKKPRIICPAMNTAMYDDGSTEANLQTLKNRGWQIVEPAVGLLACGDVGKGKLANPKDIVATICKTLIPTQDLVGRKILITAGATQESIDGVRFLSNSSSGKMGVALARQAVKRGAEVCLIHGVITVPVPSFITNTIATVTTSKMHEEVLLRVADFDTFIMAAAPSDYMLEVPFDNKVKSDKLTLKLKKTPDIAAAVGAVKGDKKLVIFAAETCDGINHAKQKLVKKNADLVVLNMVNVEGSGFLSDTNIITILDKAGSITEFGKMSKADCADVILERVL